MAQVQQQQPKEKTQLQQQIEFNEQHANPLIQEWQAIMDHIAGAKTRQITDGLKVSQVYSPGAATKSVFTGLGSNGKMVLTQLKKIQFPTEEKGKGDNKKKGFSAPCFISPEMGAAIGLTEGSPLWTRGQEPIFTSTMLSQVWHSRAIVAGLSEGETFRCPPTLVPLIQVFLPTANAACVAAGKAPIDLNKLTYTKLQKMLTFHVRKRDKSKGIGPKPTQECLNALDLIAGNFATLKEAKAARTAAIKDLEKAQEELAKAQAEFQAGRIPKTMYDAREALIAGKNAHLQATIAQMNQAAAFINSN